MYTVMSGRLIKPAKKDRQDAVSMTIKAYDVSFFFLFVFFFNFVFV